MKKIYFSVLLAGSIVFSAINLYAQTGSVTLTPLAGSAVLYPSIGAAYAAIPASTTTSYTIEILPAYTGASETYPIQLTDKGLAPGGRTITIRPAAGNAGEVIQRVTPAAGAVMQINGGDNIILDGRPGGVNSTTSSYLTVNDPFSGSNANRNIELLNAANNNTIQYVNSVAANTTADAMGSRNILIGGGTGTPTAGNNNNIIQNCVVTGGLRAIQDFGVSNAVPNMGSIIRNNTVQNFGEIGIYAGVGQYNVTIQNNLVQLQNYNVQRTGGVAGIRQQSTIPGNVGNITDNTISLITTSSTVTAIWGILDLGVGTENILRNTITSISAPFPTGNNAVYGIVAEGLAAADGGQAATFNIAANKVSGIFSSGSLRIFGVALAPFAGSTVNVVNNFVSITDDNSAALGIFGIHALPTGSSYNTNVYFNSVRIGGTQLASSNALAIGIVKENNGANQVYNQRNNISVMERTGGGSQAYFNGFWIFNLDGSLNINYNTYYGVPGAFAAGGFNGFIYPSTEPGLADYKASAGSNEQNSNFRNVTFVSNTDLHLSGASLTDALLLGNPVPGITTDIDGEQRNANAPTRGADESRAIMPVEMTSFTGISKGKYNELSWTTATESNNNGFEVEQSPNGADFRSVGFVKSGAINGMSNSALAYSFQDHNPFASSTYYRLKQLDKDGNFKYTSVINIVGGATNIQITKLYPNPVANSFSLMIYAGTKATLNLVVTDISGRALITKTVKAVEGANMFPIDAASLSAGTYIISVRNNALNETVTLKFIK